MKKHKIIFASGGTGGHLYPAIAVADAVQTLRPDWKIEFVGRNKRFEEEKVRAAGYDFWGISAKGWSRNYYKKNLFIPFIAAYSVLRLLLHMLVDRPKAVFGTGGYVSAPVIAAAKLLRIKIAIQEQNTYPGLVTRMSSRFSSRIFLAFDEALKYLPDLPSGRTMVLGVPIRNTEGFVKGDLLRFYSLDADRPILVVFGGSQGSRTLNAWMKKSMKKIVSNSNAQIIWQTGISEWQIQQTIRHKDQIAGVKIIPYLDPIYNYLAIADLILCRAGASTLAEITAFGVPAVVVPYPYATDNHQEKNARYIEDNGAGICLLEKDTDEEKIAEVICGLFADRNKLDTMSRNSKLLGHPDATKKTAEEFINMAVKND